uniref:PB1-like domain-containing protein n=1 Tax=Lactuca sativa TaxID=4236 RepID=A0A9R1VL39_LACSA|nr:hypothetical protein LSAT_V11C500292640 [Lactuca sativa]
MQILLYGHPTSLTIKLYHGGEFTKYPDVCYIEGSVNYVDIVDIYEFPVHELDTIMRGLGYGVPPIIYCHFLVPGKDFYFGLRPLGNDKDVFNRAQYASEHKFMKGVQHTDEALDDQSDKAPMMPTPTDILSHEYNRRRVRRKDGGITSCNTETYQIWKRFLECLGDEFDLNDMSNFTFVSDKQKRSNTCDSKLQGQEDSSFEEEMLNVNNNASGLNSSGSFSLMNLCVRVIFDGSNFNGWIRNIRMVTRYKEKEYVLDEKLKEINLNTASVEEIAAFEAHEPDATKVHCIMLATMTTELQKSYEDMYPYEMH